MACEFENDEAKKLFVMRVVREAIKAVDGGHRIVTQRTWLGPKGLGHLAAKRQLYCGEINLGLAEKGAGCRLNAATCAAVADPGLARVADVTDIVLKNI